MAMNANDLSKKIIDAMKSSKPKNQNDANKIFGDTLLSYIADNCEIKYSWVGVGTAPASLPDPLVTFTAKAKNSGVLTSDKVFDLWFLSIESLIKTMAIVPDNSTQIFNLWLISLESLIKAMVIVPDDSSFILSPMLFNPAGAIKSVKENEKTQKDAMNRICKDIITSIKTTFLNPIPMPGSHNGIYTGTAIMTIVL